MECLVNPDCPAGELCNTATNTCVPTGCTSDADCSAPTPACDTSTTFCVECTGDSHCSGGTPVCETSGQVCVECLSDTVCSGSDVCNLPTNTCTPTGCTSDSDCSDPTPVCDSGSGLCIACVDDGDCSNPTTVCDTAVPVCVECPRQQRLLGAQPPVRHRWQPDLRRVHPRHRLQRQRCLRPGPERLCARVHQRRRLCGACACVRHHTTTTCVECLVNSDCAAGELCNTATNLCVPTGCTSDSDCSAPTPACDTSAALCLECTGDSHCSVRHTSL